MGYYTEFVIEWDANSEDIAKRFEKIFENWGMVPGDYDYYLDENCLSIYAKWYDMEKDLYLNEDGMSMKNAQYDKKWRTICKNHIHFVFELIRSIRKENWSFLKRGGTAICSSSTSFITLMT